jgi:hypothetical protein
MPIRAFLNPLHACAELLQQQSIKYVTYDTSSENIPGGIATIGL